MGLGKTIQAIAYCAHLKSTAKDRVKHLIVVPTSVLGNWGREFHRFAPTLRVQRYYGARRHLDPEGWDVCLTSYGVLRRDVRRLGTVNWHSQILDEAQMIKTPKSQSARAVRRIGSRADSL